MNALRSCLYYMKNAFKTALQATLLDQGQYFKGREIVGFVGNYSLAPDGKHFAALMPVETSKEEQSPNHVVLLMNFFDELRRKSPLSK